MVELRLDSIQELGLPQDCFVSVRIGETQKLSRLSASRVYRFPKAGDRRYGKIEVFRRIGACSLDVDPENKDAREVNISCEEAGFGKLGLNVSVVGETKAEVVDPVELKKEGNKVKAAKEYLSKHGLEVRLSEAMQAVLRERPADPAQFLAGKLLETKEPTALKPKPAAAKVPVPAEEATTKALVEEAAPKQPQQQSPEAPSPASTPNHLLPSVGTWLSSSLLCRKGPSPPAVGAPQPAKESPASAVVLASPSPSTATPQTAVTAAATVAAAAGFRLRPSVGTWLARVPQVARPPPSVPQEADLDVSMVKAKAKEAIATAVGAAASGLLAGGRPRPQQVSLLPSVASWLQPLPKARRAATPSVTVSERAAETTEAQAEAEAKATTTTSARVAPVAAARPWTHLPSVGTWLVARPPQVQKPQVAEERPALAFEKRPSVGTWMVPRRRKAKPSLRPKVRGI